MLLNVRAGLSLNHNETPRNANMDAAAEARAKGGKVRPRRSQLARGAAAPAVIALDGAFCMPRRVLCACARRCALACALCTHAAALRTHAAAMHAPALQPSSAALCAR
jgi:hypothetical protein